VILRSRVKVPRVTFVKNGFHSFSWELFITELLYIMGWLLLVMTKSLLILGLLGQRLGPNGHFCKNNVNLISAHYLETCLSQSFSYFTCWLALVRTWPLLILRSKGKVTIVTFVKKIWTCGFCSLSWEQFITELLYFTRWLVLARTQSLMFFFSLLGQRSRLHSSLLWSTM